MKKKLFHSDCLKCGNCSKKVSPSGAEAKRTGDEIEVYCKKCWGELGLNRASVALKKSADASSDSAHHASEDHGASASSEQAHEYAAAAEPEYAAAEEPAAAAEPAEEAPEE